jgi:hypothetical protein
MELYCLDKTFAIFKMESLLRVIRAEINGIYDRFSIVSGRNDLRLGGGKVFRKLLQTIFSHSKAF